MSKGSDNRSDTEQYRKNASKVKNNLKPKKEWESAASKKRRKGK